MRTVAYSLIEAAVARRMRWSATELDAHDFASIRDAVSAALEEIWTFEWWRDLTRSVRRRFAPAYDPGLTYHAGAAVYHIGSEQYYVALVNEPAAAPATEDAGGLWTLNAAEWGYWARAYDAPAWQSTRLYSVGDQVTWSQDGQAYQCHTPTAAGDLPSDAAHWGLLPLMVPQVDYDEPGFEVIGDVEGAYDADPDAEDGAPPIEHRMGPDGVLFFGRSVRQPWIKYRTPAPRLLGEAWDAHASYGPDTTTEDTDMPLTGYNGAAQLRAKTTYVDREMAYIFYWEDPADGAAGWFRFVASSTDADAKSDVIRPTNNPLPAPGAWHRVS